MSAPMSEADAQVIGADAGAWLRRRGAPTLAPDRKTAAAVWERTRPILICLFGLSIVQVFSLTRGGLSLVLAFVLAALAMTATMAAVNWVRGRGAFETPRDFASLELSVFVLLPTALSWVVSGVGAAMVTFCIQVMALVALYAVVSLGVLWTVRWALKMVATNSRSLLRLTARALPVLLLLTLFMFINAEAWQVANSLQPGLAAALGWFWVAVLFSYLWFVSDDLVDEAESVIAAEPDMAFFAGSPIARHADSDLFMSSGPLPQVAGASRVNLRLIFVSSIGVQAILVAALLTCAYAVLGSMLVTEEVQLAWLAGPVEVPALFEVFVGSTELRLTRAHVLMSAAIGALSALSIAVSAVSEESLRRSFCGAVLLEVEQDLAVHHAAMLLTGLSKDRQ